MDERPPADRSKEHNLSLLGDFIPVLDEELDKLLGTTFIKTMRQYSALPDTFGLCGVTALDAAGKFTRPDLWRDVTYDAHELKEKFDKKFSTGDGHDAIETFWSFS